MVGASNLKALHPLQVFSNKPPISSSSSSTISSIKIKNLIHTLIFSHVWRFIRALSRAKSKATSHLLQFLKECKPMQLIYTTRKNKKKNKTAKMFFGSFRLHYNWCSSTHVLPVPASVYDATWRSECPESQLSGYLQWLEERDKVGEELEVDANEIDLKADLFIASCHEKFRLEKQESYRRFQEMLARSM